MKKGGIAVLGLGILALSVMGKKSGFTEHINTPTISPQQAVQIGAQTLPLNTYLNSLANQVAYGGNQYNTLLDLQKQIAGIQLTNVHQSGFMDVSEGFAKLAQSLGIVIK